MARLHYNGLSTTLGGTGLTSSATSVTFAAALTYANGTAVPTITGSDYIPLAILDSSGHLSEVVWLTAYTSGATTGTIARGKETTTGVAHSSGDKVTHGPLSDDVSGPYLAYVSYKAAANYTGATATFAVIDSTNLKITFTAPSSGAVLVELSALTSGPTAPNYVRWSLFESGTMITGSERQALNSTGSIIIPVTTKHVITGLTPGSSHTYTWGWAVSAGGTTIYATADPVALVVSALP